MAKNEAEKAQDNSEFDKANGLTPSQVANREYHEGDFQTVDPVTGTARKLPEDVTAASLEQVQAATFQGEVAPAKTTAKKPAK